MTRDETRLEIPPFHYMIATGPSLSKAMWLAVEVETPAR
jgi:ribulose-5-phosphate 4-epimerase/fuculose-1-phosphate aldolase